MAAAHLGEVMAVTDVLPEEKPPRFVCPEWGSEAEKSSSERGELFCPECTRPRKYRDVNRRCTCCQLHLVSDGQICANCREHGCDSLIQPCSYRKEYTSPSECEHNFFDIAFKDGIECRWCGYINSGGPSPDYGETWGHYRLKGLERDSYQCQKCGISQQEHRREYEKGLHVHHLTPFREFEDEEKAHQLDNLITLCKECHREVEPLDRAEQASLLGVDDE